MAKKISHDNKHETSHEKYVIGENLCYTTRMKSSAKKKVQLETTSDKNQRR